MLHRPHLKLREDGPLVRERAAAVTAITESSSLIEVAGGAADAPANRKRIQIITPGWGSSGYYSADVLEQAAKDRVIPAGTHMYLNHASETDRHDRPERDVEKIAAVLVEDATWDGTRLIGDADLMGPHAELIEALAPYIGVSISGSATDVTVGEAEGRTGPIIEGLAHVESVDFVTHAGRGGMILLEAARPSMVNAAARDHGIAEATVNDTREALTAALRDTYGGENTYVWVRDFDATTVWFDVEDGDSSGMYGQGYTQTDTGAVTLTGDWTEVRVVTSYVPVDAAASGTATEGTTLIVPATRPDSTNTTKENTMPQIEEARLRQLEADAGRVTTLESERDQARNEAAQLRALEGARTRARTSVVAANATLADPVVARIVEAATRGDLPLTADGALDEAAFDTRVNEVRTTEETYLASLTAGTTAGVHGFGASAAADTEVVESAPTRNPWGRELPKGA